MPPATDDVGDKCLISHTFTSAMCLLPVDRPGETETERERESNVHCFPCRNTTMYICGLYMYISGDNVFQTDMYMVGMIDRLIETYLKRKRENLNYSFITTPLLEREGGERKGTMSNERIGRQVEMDR